MPRLHPRAMSAACAVAALALLGTTTPAHAATATQHGPNPTADSITKDGTYAVATKKIPANLAVGHAGGTLYYPSQPGAEKFGLVVTMPGFTEPGVAMQVIAKRLASHGFVVMQAETFTTLEQPPSRARIALAALKATEDDATAKSLLNGHRALIGHSMGGGGVLHAAESADLDGVVAIHPWAQKGFGDVTEPTLVIGGGIDGIASYRQYTLPIHDSLTQSADKALLTDWAGTHWAGLVDNPKIQSRLLSFVKATVDGDSRYRSFYCGQAPEGLSFQSASCSGQ